MLAEKRRARHRGIVEPVETPSGTRWLQTDKFPTRDEEGRITGLIGFAMDITERKQVEEALRARDGAEAANRLKSQFLAQMSHEHRTVLVLHYYMDLSCPEIASILNCPEGTVHSRLHYARRVVQAQLEHHAPQPITSEVEV